GILHGIGRPVIEGFTAAEFLTPGLDGPVTVARPSRTSTGFLVRRAYRTHSTVRRRGCRGPPAPTADRARLRRLPRRRARGRADRLALPRRGARGRASGH